MWKVVIPPERTPELRVHKGYEWLYVLSGRMRLILGEHDITMGPGEVAEFDTELPHWFGPRRSGPLAFVGGVFVLFGGFDQPSDPLLAFTLPEIAWELSLALYLTFNGFRPSSRYIATEPVRANEGSLTSDAYA